MQLNRNQLWSFTVVAAMYRNIDLVRNNYTGQLMVRRLSAADSYPVMSRLCSVRGQNLMEVYDCMLNSGICVSLCEYISGYTLDTYIAHNGVFKEKDAKGIICQICDGLEVLHKNGIVHRDIKPENIMLDNSGKIKIIDYSISRLVKPNMRKDTEVLGTAGYASPEQFGFKQTSGKADIYSCGVLLNYLLTGMLPNEYLYKGALCSVIETCIEIDEDKRFSSVKELKEVVQGKRKNLHRRFRPLPGFRSKHIFPKIITTFFIVLWFLMLIFYIYAIPRIIAEYPRKYMIDQLVLCSQFMLFWSLLPYLFFGDVFRMSEKIYPKNPENGKYILYFLGILSIVIGIALMFI